jgi:UDP-N-acetylmuramoylalanine--D-glutamate ligase
MTPVHVFRGRTVALFGLGGSGLATALALQAGGAEVVAWDDSTARVAAAAGQGVGTGDLTAADWTRFAALVLSPGVPLTHPAPHWTVERAKAAGVEIIGDIELFCRERAASAPAAPFIAITGTNGKSTTTALVSHVLAHAGRDVQMGGNIGTAILSLAPPSAERTHVVECSSFQIDLTPSLAPSVGIHLNLSPDHLDRHGDMDSYAAIKERLVADAGMAIVGVDDGASRAIAERRGGRGLPVACISVERELSQGFFAAGSRLVWRHRGLDRTIADLAGVGSLRGAHNAQNALAAAAACLACGMDLPAIARGLATFPGLRHRMEQVGRIGRVLFVNDSKATNADSTEKALSSFASVRWILGGTPKEGGITPLAPFFPRVVKAYLIGAAARDFAETLEGHAPYELCGDLDTATRRAAQDAREAVEAEPVVLLSPACASYDQFRNFEERGNRFREIVQELAREDAAKSGI